MPAAGLCEVTTRNATCDSDSRPFGTRRPTDVVAQVVDPARLSDVTSLRFRYFAILISGTGP